MLLQFVTGENVFFLSIAGVGSPKNCIGIASTAKNSKGSHTVELRTGAPRRNAGSGGEADSARAWQGEERHQRNCQTHSGMGAAIE
jgi:hypothetical protein